MSKGEDFVDKYVARLMPNDKKEDTRMISTCIKNEIYAGESCLEDFSIDDLIEIISESISFIYSDYEIEIYKKTINTMAFLSLKKINFI
jgi:hypothetical protein